MQFDEFIEESPEFLHNLPLAKLVEHHDGFFHRARLRIFIAEHYVLLFVLKN